METLTLLFFVLMLIVVAFLVTQTIRRDLKARERTCFDPRRESMHTRHTPTHHALHSSLQHHVHKPPPRPF